MKLAVYAICRNEERNAGTWLAALLPEMRFDQGDSITVVDTGSTDLTTEVFESKRGLVNLYHATVRPWRFDVARNTALSLVPATADLAWSLDLDEFPRPGWRERLEAAYTEGIDRYRYRFVWSHNDDDSDGIVFHADKLHIRHGFRWRGIAHEWLAKEDAEYSGERQMFVSDIVVDHRQDFSLNRLDRDMELMDRAIREMPDDDRLQHYYARQLFFMGRMEEASLAFQRHLDNPKATWRHERSQSMLYLARVGGNEAWERQWLYRALAECPERRETWVAVAEWEAAKDNLALAIEFLAQALKRPREEYYLTDPSSTDAAISERLEALWLAQWEEG